MPFQISGRTKKVTKSDIDLCTAWVKVYSLNEKLPHIVRCRNHDWLDWGHGNIWIEWDEQRAQARFERQNSYVGNRLPESAIQTAFAKATTTRIHVFTDPDIAAIFEEAARRPAQSTRVPLVNGDEKWRNDGIDLG